MNLNEPSQVMKVCTAGRRYTAGEVCSDFAKVCQVWCMRVLCGNWITCLAMTPASCILCTVVKALTDQLIPTRSLDHLGCGEQIRFVIGPLQMSRRN